MSRTRARCVLVWLVVSAGAAAALVLLLPGTADLTRSATGGGARAVGFDQALVALCTGVLAICVLWAWLVASVVVGEAWVRAVRPGGRLESGRVPGVPAWARRLVLAACGTALLVTASPAGATPASHGGSPAVVADAAHPVVADLDLDGLPFPDRPAGPDRPAVPRPPLAAPTTPPARPGAATPGEPTAATYEVRPGDSLWALTERAMAAGRGQTDAARVAAAVDRTYARNRGVVGDDPDLILPGQRLRLPRA